MTSKLGEILSRLGYITEEDIQQALKVQRSEGGSRRLGEILSELFLNEEILSRALSAQERGTLVDPGLDIVSQVLRHRLDQDDIRVLLDTINVGNLETFQLKVADVLEKVGTFLDISYRISDVRSLDAVLRSLIDMVCEALSSDRATLFLSDKDTGELYSRILGGQSISEIRFPNHLGIAGSVFTKGETINIPDAYSDPRFNPGIDKKTGYRTRNILCAPVNLRSGERIGVIQVINKLEGEFDMDDIMVLEAITLQTSAALQNAALYEQIRKAREEEAKLLEVTNAISSMLQLLPLLEKIMETTTDILEADRSTLFLYDDKTSELWSQIAQGDEVNEIRFPSHLGIAGSVFTTGHTVNIPIAYEDPRFNQEIDKQTGYRTKSILCMPVINKNNVTIGVVQVLNRRGGPFTREDERRLKAFTSQASIAIENAQLFEEVLNMKNYNESMLGSLSNGVMTIDPLGHIVKVNSAAEQILLKTGRQMTGMEISDLFTDDNAWIIDRISRVVKSQKFDISMDSDLFLPDGGTVSVNLTVVPLISVKEEPIGTMLVIEDITREKRLKGTMARYMTKEVAEKLIESGDEMLGGTTQTASVLFSDIRGFTTLAEGMTAAEVVSMLNEYFTVMVDIIFQYKGILDKYIGDAIMAVFGPPFASGKDADNSVRASIAMISALMELNTSLVKRKMKPLEIGIGINTDEVLSGNIGSIKRMDYTVIGDGVNLASRLEGANKLYGSRIIISEFTKEALLDKYTIRMLDNIRVKGKEKPVGIYEIMDYHTEKTFPGLEDAISLHHEALDLYISGKWAKAAKLLNKAKQLNPGDMGSRTILERCNHFMNEPPDGDWDGVWEMEGK
jgi:adenylate cyclase